MTRTNHNNGNHLYINRSLEVVERENSALNWNISSITEGVPYAEHAISEALRLLVRKRILFMKFFWSLKCRFVVFFPGINTASLWTVRVIGTSDCYKLHFSLNMSKFTFSIVNAISCKLLKENSSFSMLEVDVSIDTSFFLSFNCDFRRIYPNFNDNSMGIISGFSTDKEVKDLCVTSVRVRSEIRGDNDACLWSNLFNEVIGSWEYVWLLGWGDRNKRKSRSVVKDSRTFAGSSSL